jgi:hypothetical protein
MRRFFIAILLLVLIPLHIFALGKATEASKLLPKEEATTFVIPSPILRITALEFRGLASDFMFLKALVFLGSAYERQETPRVKEWEWRNLYNILVASTDLDPYFYDPYYFANANLTWSAGLVKETDTLLEKGSRYRVWDWSLPFWLGFNQFYFLQETDKASEYLMEASRRPGGSPLYASLAARIAYKGRKTENAILFLEELLRGTQDYDERKYYQTRLEALQAIQYLETSVDKYKTKFGKVPADINDLAIKKIISNIPKDPYGGKFFLDPDGSVKTTSDSMLLPYHH